MRSIGGSSWRVTREVTYLTIRNLPFWRTTPVPSTCVLPDRRRRRAAAALRSRGFPYIFPPYAIIVSAASTHSVGNRAATASAFRRALVRQVVFSPPRRTSRTSDGTTRKSWPLRSLRRDVDAEARMNMRESVDAKGVRLKHKILQSPMAGCTDLAYRKIARRFGCQIAFTEMVKDQPVVQGNPKTLDMLRTADWDHPLGMQVVGRDPELMREAAKRLEALGADVIDVNLGCPMPKVVNNGCGAALLREPAQVGRILEAMVAAVRVPVTIKMRTGFGDGDDDRFLQIATLAGECGAGAITVHGRTRKQMYTGFSNHEAIRAVKEVARIPVIGNGDIRSGADAKKMIEDTGCDGVM